MKYSELRKGLTLKTLLTLGILLVCTTSIVSQNYNIPPDNDFITNKLKKNLKLNEERQIFRFNLNTHIFLGITISQLETKDSLYEEVTLISILIITTSSIVIKKYKKISKSEINAKINLHQIENNIPLQENFVLNLIQDYLSKNRYLEVSKIIPYLHARLSKSDSPLNKNGIEVVVNNLIKKCILVDGSKLTRDDVLKNPNRLRIYNTILNNPGIHFMGIINLIGISIFLGKWHLNMLLKFNLIKKTRVENREIYYDSSLSEEKAKILHFMGRERTLRIISYLRKNPNGTSKYRISKDLKMHQNTVSKYIKKLEALDILSRENCSTRTLYFLKSTSIFN
ncbi:MAG: hypothetical protein ACFFDH_04695 [Promethearchaeota archaeon]